MIFKESSIVSVKLYSYISGNAKIQLGIQVLLSLVTLISTPGYATTPYIPIDRDVYRNIEYVILKSDSIEYFILSQPYFNTGTVMNNLYFKKFRFKYPKLIGTEEGVSIQARPGWISQNNSDSRDSYPTISIGGNIKIGNFTGVGHLMVTKYFNTDQDFHGDKTGWTSAYLSEGYAIYKINSTNIFGGRMPRNYGIINEYGLLFSDNPYPFDHYGFTTQGTHLQYSYYFARLNDMEGIDDQGILIPVGDTKLTNRFMAFQRLDIKINSNMQMGISEAALYGGPDQAFVAAYLNPMNFYYLSQRNQKYQMNGAWQVNFFYHFDSGIGLYFDIYIDDAIINNNEQRNDRELYQDRVAAMGKITFPDFIIPSTITTLRYVRIWNETYVTFRNFENWIFYNKYLGFPYRAYEGLKAETTILSYSSWQSHISCGIWQKGDREVSDTFQGDATIPFPAPPVIKGIDLQMDVVYGKNNIDGYLKIYMENSYNSGNNTTFMSSIQLGVNYRFNYVLSY